MPLNTKYRCLISSQLGINLSNLDLDAPPRRVARTVLLGRLP